MKSCKYCGGIHEAGVECQKKPKIRSEDTFEQKFRWSRRWREKREQIRERDNNLCQICIRNLYGTVQQYNYLNLSVHHAVPLKDDYTLRLDDDNLITMCDMHHLMAERGEIPLEEILDIIKVQQEHTDIPPGSCV